MVLFFDTETTGRPNSYTAPASDSNNWPRMVQLAWVLTDGFGNILQEDNCIIKPDGYTIPQDVVKIHGITQAIALEKGKDLGMSLLFFENVVKSADLVVAHNMEFDDSIVRAEYFRKSMPTSLTRKAQFCTMKSQEVINHCALWGFKGYKWPKLTELHEELFGTDFTDAHNALNDVKATVKCYWELKRLGII